MECAVCMSSKSSPYVAEAWHSRDETMICRALPVRGPFGKIDI